MKLKDDIQLQENFWINEFLSDNDAQNINQQQTLNLNRLAEKLQMLRDIIDDGITINSGFRGVAFNKSKKVGGSTNSYHLTGLAADIKFDFSKWNKHSLMKILKYCGFKNVNFYWTADRKTWVWLHVDLGKPWDNSEFYVTDKDANTQKSIVIK